MRIWPEKALFWGVMLVQVQSFETGTKYGVKTLDHSEKRGKVKSQKFLEANC